MSDHDAGGRQPSRRFSEKEVAQIIKRASELQVEEAPTESSSGMSLAELEQVAREAGLDPALVRRAASDLDQRVTDQPVSRLAGAPTTLRLERTIDGEISSEEFETLAMEIEQVLGYAGTASTLGRSLQWTSTYTGRRPMDWRSVQVTMRPRDGRTTIIVQEHLHELAGRIFGGMVGGGGGSMSGLAMGIGLGAMQSPSAALGLVCAALGGSYLLARTVYTRMTGNRGRRLQQLMSRLSDRVTDATATPAERLPPRPPERDALGQGG